MNRVVSAGMKRMTFGEARTVIQIALKMPFFSNASIAYSEQVGVNRQVGGKTGDR